MQGYLEAIRTSVLFFPIISFLFTIPYLLIQYHKYGSVHILRSIIVYSFILYLVTAYFLVILPLPTLDTVLKLKTPTMQLIPFTFITDFISHTSFVLTNPNTYLTALKEPYLYQVLYNVLLMVPFGIYLRYYFKCSLKKTVFLTFLLSLFFELTQLSGLYGLYPRSYRLFDVDDLMINTVGGVIGYLIAGVMIKCIPSREKIDRESYENGTRVSMLRRMVAFSLDQVLYLVFTTGYVICVSRNYAFLIMFLVYYLIIPMCLEGQTIGERFLNLKVVSTEDAKLKFWQLCARRILFYLFYFVLPFLVMLGFTYLLSYFQLSKTITFALALCILLSIFIYYLYAFICVSFLKKHLFYESISKTKLVSTIEFDEEKN